MYSYAADESVVELILLASRRERDTLTRAFAGLADNPYQSGEFQLKDSVGRPLEVKRFGCWMVTWWAEHWAKEVRIVSVRRITP